MATSLSILVLEDRQEDAEMMIRSLRSAEIMPQWQRVETEEEYVQALARPWDVVLADYRLPQFNALRAIALLKERRLDIPVIVVTGSISEEVAVECMKCGAADYLLKDRLVRLGPAVHQALEARQMRRQRLEAEEALRRNGQRLKELNETLERRVAERTAEAEQRAAQLRELTSELTRAEQHEHSRLARILHDHLQQLLVGAKFSLSTLRRQLTNESQRQALQKADGLLDESLAVSRDLTIELSPPILYEGTLAAALHWLVRWMHDKHGLQVHLKVDETLNPQDEGTRILLFESVRELLFNIVKHSGTNSACTTLERHSEEQLRIVVADAGGGFDVGQQSLQDRSTGGFGLFSMRERLRLIGGQLDIDSVSGTGTTVTVVAPLRLLKASAAAETAGEQVLVPSPETREELPGPPVTRGEAERIRVLVADDHAVVRDGLAQLLQLHPDVEVVGLASNGQHAVELAIGLRPDVILMDVSMPRLNGIEATRRVRSELPQVRVIGLSMHSADEVAARMREAGAVDYLTKTAPPEEVVAAIRKCVNRPAR